MAQRIGFVGIGTIGKPMALNIKKGGFELAVFDLDQRAVADLVEVGATGKASPAAVAEASDIVITMVPDAPDVEKAALGAGGVIEGLAPGGLYIDMSTVDPETTRKVGAAMAARGIRMIDAPVGRTVDNAYAGTLSIMVGGEAADVEEAMPVLRCMGTDITHCGPLGNGHAVKLVNNYISGGILALLSEGLTMGVKAGLTLETMLEVVGATFAASGVMTKMLPAKAFRGDFSPGFKTTLSHKDIRLGLGLATAAGLDAPVGHGVFTTLTRAIEAGHGDEDFTSMLKVNEAKAGVEVRLKAGGR